MSGYMQKYLFFFFSLIVCNVVFPLPSNNPSSPHIIEEGVCVSSASWADFRIGYEGNFVANRRMRKANITNDRIDNFALDMNGGSFTLNIQKRFDMYAIGGEARIKSYWRYTEANQSISRIDMETKYHWAYAGGARAVFFEWGNTSLGMGGRYFVTHPRILWMTKNGEPLVFDKAKCRYSEWQIDLGVSYLVDIFIPYLGVKYSWAKARVSSIPGQVIADEEDNRLRMKSRRKVGMMVGCSVSSGKIFFLNIEARLFDEEAATVTGEFCF